MKQEQSTTMMAGVDVGKAWLDVAVHGGEATRVANDETGIAGLLAWLSARSVGRVGMEASGGYERAVRVALEVAKLEVVVHQPLEVRLFARLKRVRSKTDKIDAVVIAAATAQVDTVRAASDPRLVELAERMTAYEQAADAVACLKTQLEQTTLKDLILDLKAQIEAGELRKAKMIKTMQALVKGWPDLAERLALLDSLPGFGPVVGLSVLVRMPELGAMKPGQAASLLGVAPFAKESGQYKGARFIAGGRSRPRRMLYMAALAAVRCDKGLAAFAERLEQRGKPPKLILAAVMRKLIEAANLVLARGRPWSRHEKASTPAPCPPAAPA